MALTANPQNAKPANAPKKVGTIGPTPRVLVLTKKFSEYGDDVNQFSGLNNTARFLVEALNDILNIAAKFVPVIDGNGIDAEVFTYKPTHVILEALWVTPAKLTELQKLYPKTIWVVRIHSKIPFLAGEGIAIEWITQYKAIPNVIVGFNARETTHDFEVILPVTFLKYLPNIYRNIDPTQIKTFNKIMQGLIKKIKNAVVTPKTINVGCFGAVRPFKNILIQGFAAIKYAQKHNLNLTFSINVGRVEQHGESTLKNLRALFASTPYVLNEVNWLTYEEFITLIKTIDIGLQVSLSESFNVVTADYIYNYKPIVVSSEVNWVAQDNVVPANTVDAIVAKMEQVIGDQTLLDTNLHLLNQHNIRALNIWNDYLYGL